MVHVVVADLLHVLARRVRARRAELGWTRAALAERSGLSIRFLARIEGGDGNVSLLRLAGLAGALGTTPGDLIGPAEERTPIVALVGMRGAGKSTIGPLLAASLGRPFIEMDARIREAAGLPLDQLFELHGERFYRRIERETLERILGNGAGAVVAAAGGIVNEPQTWDLLLRRTTVVWLKARPEDHWDRVVAQGDRRPMADSPDALAELRSMLAARERLYAQAHVVVDTHRRTAAEVARAVEREVG
jgi:XRE family aerobic/anaerobic benzoate catabolism transcriptional regulator